MNPCEVHVWRAVLDRSAAAQERLQQTLSVDERARAERFYFPRDRDHFIVARGLLRTILSRYLDQPPERIVFDYSAHGKPSLADVGALRRSGVEAFRRSGAQGPLPTPQRLNAPTPQHLNAPTPQRRNAPTPQRLNAPTPQRSNAPTPPRPDATLRFNLSHSHGLALYAITRDREIGVDLEFIRPEVVAEPIAERFFAAGEIAALRVLPAAVQPEAFFHCWTRKEAYIKAKGQGLSIPLDAFEVSLAPGTPAALLSVKSDPEEASRWSLRELAPGSGYAAALAVEGEDWQLRCWEWPVEKE